MNTSLLWLLGTPIILRGAPFVELEGSDAAAAKAIEGMLK
jgi:hypothetical protein